MALGYLRLMKKPETNMSKIRFLAVLVLDFSQLIYSEIFFSNPPLNTLEFNFLMRRHSKHSQKMLYPSKIHPHVSYLCQMRLVRQIESTTDILCSRFYAASRERKE